MQKYVFFIFLFSLFPNMAGAVSPATYKQVNDIPYRTEGNPYALSRCKIDLYYPVGVSGFATLVWFHGGGLTGGEKFVPAELKDAGLAVVAVNYRLLCDSATLDDCIDDAAAAVAWTFNHIGEYGGDRRKIFVTGHSAGVYLTGMVGLYKRWLAAYGIDADSIAGLLPLSGHAISHFAYRKQLGMKDTQPSIDRYAPIYYVRPDAPPFIIVSGDREMEMLGRYEENAYLWRMLKVVGHPYVHIYELDGYNHGDMVSPAFHIVKNEVKALLKRQK